VEPETPASEEPGDGSEGEAGAKWKRFPKANARDDSGEDAIKRAC